MVDILLYLNKCTCHRTAATQSSDVHGRSFPTTPRTKQPASHTINGDGGCWRLYDLMPLHVVWPSSTPPLCTKAESNIYLWLSRQNRIIWKGDADATAAVAAAFAASTAAAIHGAVPWCTISKRGAIESDNGGGE